MKKNNGNSGLYGRVTKKQMGGAAKPVGMSGPGFLAGEIPPDGSGSGIAMSQEAREAMKKRPPDRGGNSRGTVKTGPGRGPRGPSVDMDKLRDMILSKDLIKNANAGGARQPGADRGRPPSGDMDKFRDFIKNANAEGGKDMPRLPGGGRLRPPEMGPNPDAERMGPRRFEGMGASIIDALGIKSGKMGDKSRKEPPRPRTTGGRRGRGRRD
jgi:hypothetical protein